MILKGLKMGLMLGGFALVATPALAQQAAEPAPAGENIPPVDVIQKPKAAAKKAAPAKKKAPAKAAAKKKAPAPVSEPAPLPPPVADFEPAGEASGSPNAAQYPAGGQGAAGRAAVGPSKPVDATRGIVPGDLTRFPGAATRATLDDIEEQRPKDNHELLARVPGVATVNDDGMSRHSGVGIRGAPVRRSRKVLMLEDGQSINFSSILDPSTHYTPPTDRLESVEVIRGGVPSEGPLSNHGIVNFRNLSPFGENETVISGAIGYTEGANKDVNNMRHVHTRRNLGHVGVVASYSGAEAGGAWDNEVLRYNDFYGALGFKGTNQDLTISGVYFRQRDNYDEVNFEGPDSEFFANGRNHDFAPTGLNTYNADFFRLQIAHNYYIDRDTTLSTRLYGHDNERDRYEERDDGIAAGDHMRGRERRYGVYGVDQRLEFANRAFFAGMTQDIQVGWKYEHHQFRNCNSLGARGQILKGHSGGSCSDLDRAEDLDDNIAKTKSEADAFAAFFQTAIHVTPRLIVTPGIRYEGYDITRNEILNTDEDPRGRQTSDHDNWLPSIRFAWEAMPRTTIYGGYNRGITPQVTRDPAFPLPDERGDNFQIGARSTAMRGVSFDVAYFHSRIDNYQIKEPESDALGNAIYGAVDEVEINGVEVGARLDTQPYHGGSINFFGEATWTFADSVIEANSVDPSVEGNLVPEVPRHYGNFTVGVEKRGLWDASISYTYRGEFFTDEANSPAGSDDEGLTGLVDDVWLLSARANFHVPNTNLSLFVAGQNLTDEFYIADRSDGIKPGVGRTLWAGFKYKF